MKNEDSTDSYNTLPNKISLLPLEIQWIKGILGQIQFANSILTQFRIETRITKFCHCCCSQKTEQEYGKGL
jgi:hypothetical protein